MLLFIAQGLGLPFLSPYLQSIGSNFTHGANFATAASTVRLPSTSVFVSGVSPFSLAIQLNQMKEFRTRVLEFSNPQGIMLTVNLRPIFKCLIYLLLNKPLRVQFLQVIIIYHQRTSSVNHSTSLTLGKMTSAAGWHPLASKVSNNTSLKLPHRLHGQLRYIPQVR